MVLKESRLYLQSSLFGFSVQIAVHENMKITG